MKIVFMGTPDFARDSLESIYNAGHNISAVITVPDKPKGRGMKLIPSDVKKYAIENNFTLYQPEDIKNNQEIIDTIKNINPDVICVVAYGKIIPKDILDIPRYGCVNVHPSLLPMYRGPAPIQWAILNGDEKTGVSTMYLDEGMDSGDIILQTETKIKDNETSGELWDRLSKAGAELLVETLDKIEKGIAPRKKQGNKFTVAPMLEKNKAKIDWEKQSAKEIKNLTRGLNPIMGAYCILNEKKIKFWNVDTLDVKEFISFHKEFEDYEYRFSNIEPGTIIYIDKKEAIYIAAKNGIIKVLEIQGENARRMSTPEFLRGNTIEAIDKFD